MAEQKDLGYFMKLNYNVTLTKNRGFYYLFIPELSLIAEGETLKESYEKLEQEKTAYFKRIIELNAQDAVREPASHFTAARKMGAGLLIFCQGSDSYFCYCRCCDNEPADY